MLRGFALSRQVFARPGRAKNLFCDVEHARSACSTSQNKSGECRRREQAMVRAIRQTPREVWQDSWIEDIGLPRYSITRDIMPGKMRNTTLSDQAGLANFLPSEKEL
jgi:hypothetical protein